MIGTDHRAAKVRRRVKRGLATVSEAMRWSFATPYYDHVLARRIRIHEGSVAWSPRAAIYLIFPRQGLARSHLASLRYLVGKGCAPIVVSNLPLAQDERRSILDLCHKLIERPNYGYDFGGYRDGMLSLKADLNRLAFVALLNDSCWFPLPGSSDWLDEALAMNKDFVAATSNYGMRPAPPGRYEPIRWDYRADADGFHYCSFALLLASNLLRDPGFQRFWTTFRLTNDKFKVVERGELGLSRWVIANGFSHGATLDTAKFDAELARLPLGRIKTIVEQLIIPEERELRDAKASLIARYEGSEEWRREAAAFILLAVVQTGASYAVPEFTVREKGFAFLKKSPLWLDPDAAESTLHIARRLEGEDGAAIFAEAEALRR